MLFRSNEFLTDVLICAVENMGYGWFIVDEYRPFEADGASYALITEDEEDIQHRLDLDLIVKGIAVIEAAVLADFPAGERVDRVLANAETGERLYLDERSRDLILDADWHNDASEIDVVLALAIVECGLFGQVRYA